MPLHPQAEVLFQMMAAMPPLDLVNLRAADVRGFFNQPNPVVDATAEPVDRVENRTVPGPGGGIPVRVYVPKDSAGQGPLPITVYFHGGGWVIGTLEMYDATCTQIANRAGCIVVSVDYRLAPETPFPGAVDDAVAATRWVHQHAASLGGDPARMAVAGDSAGGNLCAVVAQQLRGSDLSLCHQVLIYPITNLRCDSASYAENGPKNYLLSDALMHWFRDQYLPDASAIEDPRASPLLAPDLAGLPPATVVTAEFDPLRDEGEAYGQALAAAGVPVTVRRWDGQMHGFAAMLGMLDAASEALNFFSAELKKSFTTV